MCFVLLEGFSPSLAQDCLLGIYDSGMCVAVLGTFVPDTENIHSIPFA